MHPGECLTVFTHDCPFAMPKGDHSSALGLTQGASSTSFLRKRLTWTTQDAADG